MLNKVMIIGRLGKDPELRYSQGGAPVANFTVATDESYMDREGNRQERTEWHRVVVFQRQAENCSNYLSKGSLVYIEGSLQTRKWQDQQGQDRYTTEIRAQKVTFLDRKGDRQAQHGDEDSAGALRQGYGQRQPQGGGWDTPAQAPRQRGGDSRQYGNASSNMTPPPVDEDMGPAFPSEAANMGHGPVMDEVPF